MNTSELIQSVSEKSEISKTESKDLYEALTSIMESHFTSETGIVIPQFGTFNIKEKNSRQSFNPASREYVLLPKKLLLTFVPASQLKEDLR
ncbi:MAG: HU family DNA-binding protein [Candidatus Marinimicrobia bacterium]|nr:HU family DNA-binding protein [Candidatus Neomarinimicrobiota bacterium]